MTFFRIPVIPIFFFAAVLLPGCHDSLDPGTDLLQIEGVSWACNVNSSYAIFGSASESEDKLELFLPASEGDLLYMFYDEQQVYHRYDPADGLSYSVTIDTLEAVSVSLNGRLSYMELSYPSCIETFKELSRSEMEQLSVLYVEDDLVDDLLPFLQEHASSLQGLGLVLESNRVSAGLGDLLKVLRPKILVMDNSWILPGPEENISLSNLELLWVQGNIGLLQKLVPCCTNLESLIIADWEPEQGELLTLAGLNHLKSLTIAESQLTSLTSLELPKSLQNLYLIDCDTLSDINSLSDLHGLNCLSLAQCKSIDNMRLLQELESLQNLSLPPETSHQEFKELTEQLKGLKLVELIDCPHIQDLSPLQVLPELKILMLQLEAGQLSRLDALNQLDLVVLTSEVFENNPQFINELRASLPDTKIVPGSGICLGSGWLLLLVPFILVFRYILRRKA